MPAEKLGVACDAYDINSSDDNEAEVEQIASDFKYNGIYESNAQHTQPLLSDIPSAATTIVAWNTEKNNKDTYCKWVGTTYSTIEIESTAWSSNSEPCGVERIESGVIVQGPALMALLVLRANNFIFILIECCME